ncbi:hypothetical protein [uncultured Thermanaerothrix sp.]|uniref:hypothetical protein n=1 Tax=uncultured Thermanaerothrix sp. TaxID=1195149 RepID=UPI00262BF769|nr:hypothetical protein [uncultured Thermanaerothrix sp.]
MAEKRSALGLRVLKGLFALIWLPLALGASNLANEAMQTRPFTWRYDDLRQLDAVNLTAAPQCDFIAAYARTYRADLEIRLDTLTSQGQADCDLYLAFDLQSGGSHALPIHAASPFAWDFLLIARAHQVPFIQQPSGAIAPLIPHILRDSQQDTWVVRLNRYLLPSSRRQVTFFVWSTLPGQGEPVDTIGPFELSTTPPAPAPLLLVFWDTFPSATPAQALRRWDGAHTGPYGQRHGLRHLINAAVQYRIPIVLADLMHPPSLAGLDAVGGLKLVQQAHRQGWLILPTAAMGAPELTPWTQDLSKAIRDYFGFSDSPLRFGAFPIDELRAGRAYFSRLSEASHILQLNSTRLLPLPNGFLQVGPTSSQIESSGKLSIPAKRALVSAALSPDPTDLVVLGESLPNSSWADRGLAYAMMKYLANHPWIHVMDEADLWTHPARSVAPASLQACKNVWCTGINSASFTPNEARWASSFSALATSLRRSSAIPQTAALRTSLVLTAAMLSHPTPDPALQALRTEYFGELGYLRQALEWASHPTFRHTCNIDLDEDGVPECILSSPTALAILSLEGGRLVHLSLMQRDGPLEVVAASAQLAVGLSDPSMWKPEMGIWADPAVIPGGIVHPQDSNVYQVQSLEANCMTLNSPQTGLEKRYCLQPSGLTITVQGNSRTPPLLLPLVLAPQQRFAPGWARRYLLSPISKQHVVWAIFGYSFLDILSNQEFEVIPFTDSIPWLEQPEDPNRAYPPGHYVLFPIALLTFKDPTSLLLEIALR